MSPQSNFPEKHRRLDEQRRRTLEGRSRDAPVSNSQWLWPVIILLAMLLWIGFWGWTSCGGWWGRHSHKGALRSNNEPGNLLARS